MASAKKTKPVRPTRAVGKNIAIYVGSILAGVLVVAGLYVEEHRARMSAKPNPYAEILFGGDMMFDRTIRQTIDQKGGDFVFSCLDDIFRSNDIVVANLEGPITD